uniref:Rad60-SLD domain-containing protein n=1 Tax=Rhabditophanes sp. KR3021 TaxID=114890 RepID=A0AC35TMS4_9BILA
MSKVSNMGGRIVNYVTGNEETFLNPTLNNNGYRDCDLKLPDEIKKMKVQGAVALLFHENHGDLSMKMLRCFNLEFIDEEENMIVVSEDVEVEDMIVVMIKKV